MSYSPEGPLKFRVFGKREKQLKYSGKGITHRPGTIHAIPSGALNRLAKKPRSNPLLIIKGWKMSTTTI